MKEIIFNTKYNNKYLYLDGNIVFLHNNFFNSIDGSTDKLDNYYTRKFIFLKEKLSKESKNITYTTNITPQIIKENIANLKQLLIEVTDGCNLACEYCGYGKLYGNYDKRNGKMQSFQQVRILLDFLINEWNSQYNNSYKNNIYIGFYGGEPLLNFKLIHEVIEYLDSKCMNNIIFHYNMTTNAMLLDRYMDYLKEKQVHLLISIDGNKENHSYRITKTGKNSFDTVYSNILKLKNKYPDYYDKYVNFNSVLHNRNSSHEISQFGEHFLNKIPRISELSKVGIAEEKYKEFERMFRAKFDITNKKIEIDENTDVESVLNDPNISIFNLFIDSFVSNTYNSLQELFEQSDKEIEYFPTGTCLPFQKKMFLTVNGKILPCEKVGQEYPLGHVDSNSIHIDYKSISEIYSKLYSELIKSCEKCFTWHNCGQCVFVLKGQEKSMACNTICSANRAYKYLSTNITTAEKYPFIYKKLIDELVNK